MRYKYIHFTKAASKNKTPVYECRNNKSNAVLGVVKWYGAWRQYCFFTQPHVNAVFSDGCLDDIRRFMKQIKNERANKTFDF